MSTEALLAKFQDPEAIKFEGGTGVTDTGITQGGPTQGAIVPKFQGVTDSGLLPGREDGARYVKGAIVTPYMCGRRPMLYGGPKEVVGAIPNILKTTLCEYDKVAWAPHPNGNKCTVDECREISFNTCY